MEIGAEFSLERWRPDFSSSGQPSPEWTRVKYRGVTVTNSLEHVDWTDNPVQVILCDACGHDRCASGNFVHVSRFGEYVLWTPAQSEVHETVGREHEVPRFLRTFGALAIPAEVWRSWPAVPAFDALPLANHRAVADAWILGPERTRESILERLGEALGTGDTLEKDVAIDLVRRTMRDLDARADEPFLGVVAPIGAPEIFYFDGPAELDWPAFAFSSGATYLVLTPELGVEIPSPRGAGRG